MQSDARRIRILDLARAQGVVLVAELVRELEVSAMTVRRDLAALAHRGLIEKIHGGGILRQTQAAPNAPPTGASQPIATVSQNAAVPPGLDSAVAYVGIVVPLAHYYFTGVIDAARQVLDARVIRRTLLTSRYRPDEDKTLARRLLDAGCTGLLLAPNVPLDEHDPKRIDWLLDLPVPAVLIERTIRSPENDTALSSVRTDHELGAKLAVRHLRSLGHRGVALVTQRVYEFTQTRTRVINGWRHAINELELDSTQSLLIDRSRYADMGPGDTDSADSTEGILDELRRAEATAVLVHNDQSALALVHQARGRGWRIPEDLSVIAYDDEVADMSDPPLTAVSPPKAWLGRAGAELLVELVANGWQGPTRHIVADPTLVIRNSTSPPRQTPLP